jgi:hypothetical protein
MDISSPKNSGIIAAQPVNIEPQVFFENGNNGNGYAFTTKVNTSGTENVIERTQYGFAANNSYAGAKVFSFPLAFVNAGGSNAVATAVVANDETRAGQEQTTAAPGATSTSVQLRNINNDAINNEAITYRATRINAGAGTGSGSLSSTIGVTWGTGYIRYFEKSSGNDIVVLQNNQVSIPTTGTASLGYTHENNQYGVACMAISSDTGVSKQIFSRANGSFGIKCYRIEGGGTSGRTRTYCWQTVWIKNVNANYGRLQIGTSGDKRFCHFKDTDDSTILRTVQYEVALGGETTPRAIYPTNQNSTGAGTNYTLISCIDANETRGYGSSSFSIDIAKSTSQFDLAGHNEVLQTKNHSWISDTIRGGTL